MNYCPKCGKPLTENATFCMNCGAKVDVSPAEPSATAVSAQKKHSFPLVAVVLIVLVAIIFCIAKFYPTIQIYRISGTYEAQSLLEDADASTIQLNTDKTATYCLLGRYDEDGFWAYENGQVLLTTTFLGVSSDENYAVYKNYLVPVDYIYTGDIPSGNQFDTTLTMSGNSSKCVFSSDGTVTKYNADGSTFNYTYTRSENWITMTTNTGSDIKYLILKDGICSDYFTKQ